MVSDNGAAAGSRIQRQWDGAGRRGVVSVQVNFGNYQYDPASPIVNYVANGKDEFACLHELD